MKWYVIAGNRFSVHKSTFWVDALTLEQAAAQARKECAKGNGIAEVSVVLYEVGIKDEADEVYCNECGTLIDSASKGCQVRTCKLKRAAARTRAFHEAQS